MPTSVVRGGRPPSSGGPLPPGGPGHRLAAIETWAAELPEDRLRAEMLGRGGLPTAHPDRREESEDLFERVPGGETSWIASTDNNTSDSRIVYRMIVNGVLDHALLGQTRTILYVPVGQTTRIDVVAVDEAGNESAPATIFVTP